MVERMSHAAQLCQVGVKTLDADRYENVPDVYWNGRLGQLKFSP
jgi:hypothetical protein